MSGSFNLEGAQKAGYSDGEIASFLATQRGFNIEAARKSGYSDGEITAFLATPAKEPAASGAFDRQGNPVTSMASATAQPRESDSGPSLEPVAVDPATLTEYGPSPTAPAPASGAPGNAAVERVGAAAADAFRKTSPILTPEAEAAVDKYGGVLATGVNPILRGATTVKAAANAGMAGLSQAVMELFGEKGGRDALALLSSLPMINGERMSPEPFMAPAGANPPALTGFPDVAPSRVTMAEVQARDGVSPLEAAQRARTENATLAARDVPTIADIGKATTIDGVIEAAAGAAEAPTGRPMAEWMQPLSGVGKEIVPDNTGAPRRLPGIYGGEPDVTTGPFEPTTPDATLAPEAAPTARPQTMREWLAAGETPTEVVPEAAQDALVPQSVGAAASRDMSDPGSIPPETPAQRATALQKMVNQSAEDRLMPGGHDDAIYVPGVERPEAMRDFSPAPEGEISSSLAHKTLYNTDSNYHDQFDAQVKKNNAVMVDKLGDLMGDANSRDAAMNEAKQLMPGSMGLFDGEKPVDAQPIEAKINEILTGPAGKRGAVRVLLNNILSNLKDADGNLETMPSMLKGVRDDITDKLYDKSPTVEGNAARTASNQLRDVLHVVDDTIASGLPGTKYQDYLSNLSAALGEVAKQDYLQRFLTGSKKVTDLSGNLLFNKVQRLLEDIQAHHADQTGGAKELSMDEIHQIEAVRNELAAKDLLDRRAAVRGSPTAQVTNSSGILGSGPLGAGIKGAAEVALHAGLAPLTGGIGNAALAGYRFIYKPAMDAAKARDAATALAATKQRLLNTAPGNPDLQ